MPRRPNWISDLAEIIPAVEDLPNPLLDRQLFGELVNLRRTAAAYWMSRLGAAVYGTTLLIDKLTLFLTLYRLVQTPEVQLEERHRERLLVALYNAVEQGAARQVRITPTPGVETIADLPSGVRLARGLLQISFFGADDLLKDLFALATVMTSDWERYEKMCE